MFRERFCLNVSQQQILIVNALQAFKSRIEEMREAITRNRQRKPFPSPLPPSTSRPKKAKVRRKSEDKHAGAAGEGPSRSRTATPDSKTSVLVTTNASFGENDRTPVQKKKSNLLTSPFFMILRKEYVIKKYIGNLQVMAKLGFTYSVCVHQSRIFPKAAFASLSFYLVYFSIIKIRRFSH